MRPSPAFSFYCVDLDSRHGTHWEKPQLVAVDREMKKPHAELVKLLELQRLKAPSVEEIRLALTLARELHGQLDRIGTVLEKNGPYHEPKIEERRQVLLHDNEQRRDTVTKIALYDFLLPAALDAIRHADQLLPRDRADALGKLGPGVLAAPAKAMLIQQLEKGQGGLSELAGLMREIGVCSVPGDEERRQIALAGVDARAALFAFTAHLLKTGQDWTLPQRKEYARLLRQRATATERWNRQMPKAQTATPR